MDDPRIPNQPTPWQEAIRTEAASASTRLAPAARKRIDFIVLACLAASACLISTTLGKIVGTRRQLARYAGRARGSVEASAAQQGRLKGDRRLDGWSTPRLVRSRHACRPRKSRQPVARGRPASQDRRIHDSVVAHRQVRRRGAEDVAELCAGVAGCTSAQRRSQARAEGDLPECACTSTGSPSKLVPRSKR